MAELYLKSLEVGAGHVNVCSLMYFSHEDEERLLIKTRKKTWEVLYKKLGKPKPHPDAASKVLKGALAKGLMTLKAGLYGNCVRLHPPLTIEDDLLEKGLNILEDAIKEAERPSFPLFI